MKARRGHPLADEGARITREAIEIAHGLREHCTTEIEALIVWRIGAKLQKLEWLWKPETCTQEKPKSTACET